MKSIFKNKLDILVSIFLVAVVLIFFSRLFFPQLSIFITPEYGRSDITHFNLPVKWFLSESLKKGQLPLWSSKIEAGYPLFAESQIGALFLPNLILFRFLPVVLAFNIGYVLFFVILILGSYWLVRYLGLKEIPAGVAALAFTFSGFFMGHINHYNLLQATALLPLIVLLGLKTVNKSSLAYFCVTSLLISQQFFAGFIQSSFITAMILILLVLIQNKARMRQLLFSCVIVIALFGGGFILSSAQMLPSFELAGISTRGGGFNYAAASFFSFPAKMFSTLLNPFALGRVSNGSFPSYDTLDANIFWENNIYIGLIPFFLALSTLAFALKTKKTLKIWLMIVIGLLLALGKSSPLYFLYTFFPFSYFTSPARYNLITLFGLSLLAGIACQKLLVLKNKLLVNLILSIILLLTVIDIFFHWFLYHPVVVASIWLKPPETVAFLKKQSMLTRIWSLEEGHQWFVLFQKQGWNDLNPYIYFRNELIPNINLIWGIPHHDSYVGRAWTKRSFYLKNMLVKYIAETDQEIKIGTVAAKIINVAAVTDIISHKLVSAPGFTKIYETPKKIIPRGLKSYLIYKNNDALPRFRLVDNYIKADTVVAVESIYNDSKFDPKKTVILETNVNLETQKKPAGMVSIVSDEDQKIVVNVVSPKKQLLVIADSFFPGWKAQIDGQQTTVYPANLNQRAVVVPSGKHQVKLYFQPDSLSKGIKISLLAHLFIIALMGWRFFFARRRSVSESS